MKKNNFLIIIAFLATTSVFGQQVQKSEQPIVNVVDTTDDRYRLLMRTMKSRQLPQATYSHNTARGKVYTLSPDNMPCLVPNMKRVTPMPQRVMPSVPNSTMPNAIPRQKIIPKEEPANR